MTTVKNEYSTFTSALPALVNYFHQMQQERYHQSQQEHKQTVNMPPKRIAVLSTAQKRSAAASFREYDQDATDSSTESESETERLKRYPAKRRPSPRKRSIQLREQLEEASPRAAGKHALKEEMKDEGRSLSVRTRAQRLRAEKEPVVKLEAMPRVLEEAPEMEDEDAKPGSGQVFVDGEESKRAWDRVMRARRTVVKRTETKADQPNLPKSNMGLFASLPGELRNRIYRLALVEGDDEPFLVSMQKNTCNLGACVHMKASTALPGILSACQQIRAEAMPIFIAENSFKFDDQLVAARCVANWLRVIGPYGSLLSKVILDIVCWKIPAGPPTLMQQKVGIHYEMTLVWKTDPITRWSLQTDRNIMSKATAEAIRADSYANNTLMKETVKGMAKEEALMEFVWSDWLAKLVYICRK